MSQCIKKWGSDEAILLEKVYAIKEGIAIAIANQQSKIDSPPMPQSVIEAIRFTMGRNSQIADYFNIDLSIQTVQSSDGLQNKIACLHDEVKSLYGKIDELRTAFTLLFQQVDSLERCGSTHNQIHNQLLLPLDPNTNDKLPDDIRSYTININTAPLTIAYAKRISRSITTIKRLIIRPIEAQIEYTQNIDPEHKAWVYSQISKHMYPLKSE